MIYIEKCLDTFDLLFCVNFFCETVKIYLTILNNNIRWEAKNSLSNQSN